MSNFESRIDVLKLEISKSICPYYTQYLEDRNLEKYKNDLGGFVQVLVKLPLFSILNRSQEEKDRIFELMKNEIGNVIESDLSEMYLETITLVIKKIK